MVDGRKKWGRVGREATMKRTDTIVPNKMKGEKHPSHHLHAMSSWYYINYSKGKCKPSWSWHRGKRLWPKNERTCYAQIVIGCITTLEYFWAELQRILSPSTKFQITRVGRSEYLLAAALSRHAEYRNINCQDQSSKNIQPANKLGYLENMMRTCQSTTSSWSNQGNCCEKNMLKQLCAWIDHKTGVMTM